MQQAATIWITIGVLYTVRDRGGKETLKVVEIEYIVIEREFGGIGMERLKGKGKGKGGKKENMWRDNSH